MNKIRVLIADDSLFMRRNLRLILESDPEIEVIGTAENGAEGLRMVKELRPDVVVLDLLMPVMDGLTALGHIMREVPTPVVVVSATTREGTRETLDALALGAVDFVTKPSGPVSLDIGKVRDDLVQKVRAAYTGQLKTTAAVETTRGRFQAVLEELSRERKPTAAPPRLPDRVGGTPPDSAGAKRLVAIAASTGGPLALQRVLAGLPANLNAGVVIVLHIAAGFVRPLAERLDEMSAMAIREAGDGEWIMPGVALIAPIGVHLAIVRRDERLMTRLETEQAGALHCPSADVLFESIAACCASETCGVILTGMGNDGALGLRSIRRAGGYTIAQDEASSIVYGMPRRAVELGGVDVSLPLDQIAAEIVQVTTSK